MNKDLIVFYELVDYFITTNELGSYNSEEFLICLYDVPNNITFIRDLKYRIDKITTKYKMIILNPTEQYTNINILDIEL